MELALFSSLRPFLLPGFSQNLDSSSFLGGKLIPKSNAPLSRTRRAMVIMSQNKARIDGVSDELNKIASENLDYAPARRRVRSAFANFQQQLDHVLCKMAPSGIRTDEWYELNSNGQEIFCKSWLPKPGVRIKGALCFCYGYGDTCTFFFEGIAKNISASGYGVYAIDHPGFGLSEGLPGYVPDFDALVDTVIEQYKKMKGRPEIIRLPHFIFGQSMGGAVALKALLKDLHEWDGMVLVASMCKAPYNVICYSDQTRLKTAVELLNATKYIESQVEKVASSMLILHGASIR